MNYHLCSATVLEHLKPAEVSRPFKSGYEHGTELYYVARFDSDDAIRYFDSVIEPYNANSRGGDIDFWFRSCNPGHMDVSRITLKACREKGLFVAIEEAINLTSETNIALTICNLAEKFNCDPVEFINRIAPLPPSDQNKQLKAEALKLVEGKIDELTMQGRFPLMAVKPYPVTGSPIVDLGKIRGRYVISFNRLATATLD